MSATESVKFDSRRVEELIGQRRFAEAQSECQACLASERFAEAEKLGARHLLGTCHYLQGHLSEAIDCFKSILLTDPKHTDAAISLSIIYNDVGRYDDAKKIYQVANRSLQLKRAGTDDLLDRKFALKHIELGDLYFKYHRYDDALDDYSRAAKLAPRLSETRIKIAKTYAKKGFTTRAIQELQQLCNERRDSVTARVHLGLMYFSQGNVIDAQLEWERALEQDPANPEIQTYLSMAKQATETSV